MVVDILKFNKLNCPIPEVHQAFLIIVPIRPQQLYRLVGRFFFESSRYRRGEEGVCEVQGALESIQNSETNGVR